MFRRQPQRVCGVTPAFGLKPNFARRSPKATSQHRKQVADVGVILTLFRIGSHRLPDAIALAALYLIPSLQSAPDRLVIAGDFGAPLGVDPLKRLVDEVWFGQEGL